LAIFSMHAAVHSYDICLPLIQFGSEHLRCRAVEAVTIVFYCHLCHYDRVPVQVLNGLYGLVDFIQVRECLENEEVGPSVPERRCLLPEGPLCLFHGCGAPGLNLEAKGTHGACNQHMLAGGLLGDAGAGPAYFGDLVLQPEGSQFVPVGSEGVGLYYIRTGIDIFPMHFAHQSGIADIELVEASVEIDPLVIEHGAHSPVAEQHLVLNQIQ